MTWLTFAADDGIHSYARMPFVLKNTRAYFQESMNKEFDSLIKQIVEVYVDDIIAKSKKKDSALANLKQVFEQLKKLI